MKRTRKNCLKIITATGTREILEFLDEHGKGKYIEMAGFLTIPTLNVRLRELLSLGLISHHLDKKETRVEWYEITNKGKKIMEHLNSVKELLED